MVTHMHTFVHYAVVKLPNTVEESSESDMEEFPSFSLVSEYQVSTSVRNAFGTLS